MTIKGRLILLDRDKPETSNLNRSPLFTIKHVLEGVEKTIAARDYLEWQGIEVTAITGTWNEFGDRLAEEPFDLWISLTNEDGAWAMVPYQLPPIVLHGTTTSGWGFGSGRHIPRVEDCTFCRMPRPTSEFRGPCAEGEIHLEPTGQEVRASLPFLSAAAAALILAEILKLNSAYLAHDCIDTIATSPNEVTADLRYGLPAVVSLKRRSTQACRGCQAAYSSGWEERGGRGRYRLTYEMIN
jgi:hypothetical protein